MAAADEANILVVDDNEMNRDVLSRRLERQGHTVTCVEDGQRALDVVRDVSFDLILLDIMMPKMNGYQVLEHLKADDALRHVPVIVISAVDELESVVRCIEMGAEDYLFKPFNPVLLKARIKASLERARQMDTYARLRADAARAAGHLDQIRSAGPLNASQAEALNALQAMIQQVYNVDGLE